MFSILVILSLLLLYFFVNIFIFNYLKNYKRFFLFLCAYLLFSLNIIVFFNFNYVFMYLLLIFFSSISFKLFSYLFFEKSPTLFLCEIIKNNNNYNEIKNNFLLNSFIEKYVHNLISSKLINEENGNLKLTNRGKYFYLFFKKCFFILFR